MDALCPRSPPQPPGDRLPPLPDRRQPDVELVDPLPLAGAGADHRPLRPDRLLQRPDPPQHVAVGLVRLPGGAQVLAALGLSDGRGTALPVQPVHGQSDHRARPDLRGGLPSPARPLPGRDPGAPAPPSLADRRPARVGDRRPAPHRHRAAGHLRGDVRPCADHPRRHLPSPAPGAARLHAPRRSRRAGGVCGAGRVPALLPPARAAARLRGSPGGRLRRSSRVLRHPQRAPADRRPHHNPRLERLHRHPAPAAGDRRPRLVAPPPRGGGGGGDPCLRHGPGVGRSSVDPGSGDRDPAAVADRHQTADAQQSPAGAPDGGRLPGPGGDRGHLPRRRAGGIGPAAGRRAGRGRGGPDPPDPQPADPVQPARHPGLLH